MLDESTIEGLTDEDTLTEVAVSRLVDDILAGTLAPGQKLLIAKLRQTYQMGATPLREALSRLCSLGFVRNETRRGFRVTPVSLADLRDITLVRTTIETAALRQAIELGDDEWEVGLIAAFARLERTAQRLGTETQQSEGAYEPAHKAFHTALLAGCGSPRLLDLHSLYYDQAKRYRLFTMRGVASPEDFMNEHRKLMERTLGGDADGACAMLASHLHLTLEAASAKLPA